MRPLLVSLVIAVFAIALVCGDEKVEPQEESSVKEIDSSVKTKRGIYNYVVPGYGHGYAYPRYPGAYRHGLPPGYTLTPGNAVVHSFNANYPKVFLPRPVLRPAIPPPVLIPSKPILPLAHVPVYANRYPVFLQKPLLVRKPIVPLPHVSTVVPSLHHVPTIVPSFNHVPTVVPQFAHFPAAVPSFPQGPTVVPTHFHSVASLPIPVGVPNALNQPSLISQDGWKPIFSSVSPLSQGPHVHQPAVTVLPPLGPSHLPAASASPATNNYYLPPDPAAHDVNAYSGNEELHQANGNLFGSIFSNLFDSIFSF